MAAKRRPITARGGLDDLLSPGLLPGEAEAPGEGAGEAALDELRPNPFQPRRSFDDAALRDLAASLRAHGVLQRPALRARPDSQRQLRSCLREQTVAQFDQTGMNLRGEQMLLGDIGLSHPPRSPDSLHHRENQFVADLLDGHAILMAFQQDFVDFRRLM